MILVFFYFIFIALTYFVIKWRLRTTFIVVIFVAWSRRKDLEGFRLIELIIFSFWMDRLHIDELTWWQKGGKTKQNRIKDDSKWNYTDGRSLLTNYVCNFILNSVILTSFIQHVLLSSFKTISNQGFGISSHTDHNPSLLFLFYVCVSHIWDEGSTWLQTGYEMPIHPIVC